MGVKVKKGSLSEKQLEILKLVAEGRANKQIAIDLGIHEQTVKNHMSEIKRKLSASDRAHAVAIGFRRGLLR